MRIVSSGSPVLQADVQGLETKLGHPLPNDYKSFLLAHNARQIRPCVLPTPQFSRSEKVVLHQMTCFCPKTTADFDYRLATYDGRIPKMMLPIASDPGGNLFLLDLNPKQLGVIYFWERAYEVEGEDPTMDNVIKVADNFTDLVARLVDD